MEIPGLESKLFGMTKAEAIDKKVCIDCKKPVDGRIWTEAGRREYLVSGLCEICFDSLYDND